jgi:hypothetical protein
LSARVFSPSFAAKSAETERSATMRLVARVLRHEAPDARGSGEVDPAHGRMADQPVHHVGRVVGFVGDQVDHTGRQAGVVERAGDLGVRARADRGRLQDDGVAVGERAGHCPGAEDHRSVPGRDPHDHAGGLANAHGEQPWYVGGDHLAPDGGRLCGRLAEHVGSQLAVEHPPAEGAAGLLSDRCGDCLRPLAKKRGGLLQQLPPLRGRAGRPLAESLRRRSAAARASSRLPAAAVPAGSPVNGSVRSKRSPRSPRSTALR